VKQEKRKIIENKFDLKRKKSKFQISKGKKPRKGKGENNGRNYGQDRILGRKAIKVA